MPWMLEGRCVDRKNPDGSKGKKKGCSKTIAGAKRYLNKLNMLHAGATK